MVAGAVPRDAITHHVLEARAIIRGMGLRSEVFCDAAHLHPAVAGEIRPHTRWRDLAHPGDLAILHYSLASPAFFAVLEQAGRSAIHYHNITPASLLWRDAPEIARVCATGRERLGELAGRVLAAAADSTFNAEELVARGFPEPEVLGVMRPTLPPPPDSPRRGDGLPRLLFVGRGAPNKAQHDLILATAALAQAGALIETWLVGGWVDAYERRCQRLAARLGVADLLRITGSVDDPALAQAYADADCFVCLSDHEGFCVPLVEAMGHDLPIVAYAAGAVPETLGGAGLLLPDKPPSLVAEAVLEVLVNPGLRASMARGRAERLAHFAPAATAGRIRAFVDGIA